MDGQMENLPILQDFVLYQGRCPATAQLQPKNCIKRGKGTADHMMPLGAWFLFFLFLFSLSHSLSLSFCLSFSLSLSLILSVSSEILLQSLIVNHDSSLSSARDFFFVGMGLYSDGDLGCRRRRVTSQFDSEATSKLSSKWRGTASGKKEGIFV